PGGARAREAGRRARLARRPLPGARRARMEARDPSRAGRSARRRGLGAQEGRAMSRKQDPSGATLEKKIEGRTCRYGVVGLGYVGLPLAVAFAKKGVSVLGFELDAAKPASIQKGESSAADLPATDVEPLVEKGLLEATTDFSRLAECDVV